MFSFLRLSFFATKWSYRKVAEAKVAKTKTTKSPKKKNIKNGNTKLDKVEKKKIQYLECFICKKRLQSNRIHNLKRHLRLHNGEFSRCKCSECGRSYSSHGNFLKHLPRWHAGRNPRDIKYEPTNEGFLVRPTYLYQ